MISNPIDAARDALAEFNRDRNLPTFDPTATAERLGNVARDLYLDARRGHIPLVEARGLVADLRAAYAACLASDAP